MGYAYESDPCDICCSVQKENVGKQMRRLMVMAIEDD
jgi:hypothetical protein